MAGSTCLTSPLSRGARSAGLITPCDIAQQAQLTRESSTCTHEESVAASDLIRPYRRGGQDASADTGAVRRRPTLSQVLTSSRDEPRRGTGTPAGMLRKAAVSSAALPLASFTCCWNQA